jgi:NAD dependent epimerase/dehydratase family enzyme
MALGRLLKRPTFAAVPAAALKAALGEFSIEVLGSAKVFPTVLEQNGFDFLCPNIDSTLRNALS